MPHSRGPSGIGTLQVGTRRQASATTTAATTAATFTTTATATTTTTSDQCRCLAVRGAASSHGPL